MLNPSLPFADGTPLYEHTLEGAIEVLHEMGVTPEIPAIDVIESDDVVGGMIQSLVMAGYQKALMDMGNGDINLSLVANETKRVITELRKPPYAGEMLEKYRNATERADKVAIKRETKELLRQAIIDRDIKRAESFVSVLPQMRVIDETDY